MKYHVYYYVGDIKFGLLFYTVYQLSRAIDLIKKDIEEGFISKHDITYFVRDDAYNIIYSSDMVSDDA